MLNLKDNKYMPKHLLFILALAVILTTAYLTLLINSRTNTTPSKIEVDTAVNQAQYLYRLKKERKEDLSNGPCLSDALMPNWVVDIVHNPRQPIDDRGENQCPAYREGRAQHFVELDTAGNLIRAQ